MNNLTLRERLTDMLQNEPEEFAEWLDAKLNDAANACCVIKDNCNAQSCAECILAALDEPYEED